MDNIDFLEHGGGHPLLIVDGDHYQLVDPRQLHFQVVLAALQAECVPGLPEGIPDWQRRHIFDRWRAAWELPLFADARRLAYLVDHYRGGLSYDLLQIGLDLGELWRARRWSVLLDIIDRLPPHSWYASSVSMDEEHAKMLAEALKAREADGDQEQPDKKGPPLTHWTPEVAALTNLLDAVRGVQYTLVAVNAEKGKMPDPPKPAPRPITPLERLMRKNDYLDRLERHKALVARVLPKKRPPESTVH